MEFSRQEYWSGLSFPRQGIFLIQGSNLGLQHCRHILYHLSHQKSPKNNEVGCYFLLPWTMFCQNSSLWPVCLGWPYMAWLIASLSYASPFTMTRLQFMKWSEVVSNSLQPHGLYSLQVSSVHGIFQARVLKWAAISFSRGSSRPRDRTRVSCIVGRCFTIWATREVPK